MDAEQLKDRLRKMKALADFGIGGEREAAERLIREISAKYGITLADTADEIERERMVEGTNEWKRKILVQLLGLMRIEQYGDRNSDKLRLCVKSEQVKKRGRKRGLTWKLRYYIRCTDAQWLELQAKAAVLFNAYEKQSKAFMLAFMIRNDLLMPYDPESTTSSADQEEYAIAERLSEGIEQTILNKQLEMKS